MENKILTISVAAYNLENLIAENMESFIKCKERNNLEVIVTDDGSNDKTAGVVENYQDKYPEIIKLIKKKNEGAGSTVNSGIKNATGKYFKMIDGDDWTNPEDLDKLINKLKDIDADMVITNYSTYDNSMQKIIDRTKYELEEGKEITLGNACKNNQFQMHNILYKTSILKTNNIVLDNGFYTDMEYLLLPVPYIKKVIYYDLDVYVYRIAREGQSVSLPSMKKNIEMHKLVLSRLLDFYEENKNNLENKSAEYMVRRISDMADTQLATLLTFNIDKKQVQKIKDFFEYMKKYDDVYICFKKGKKEKLLLRSNFKLAKIASKIVLKKIYKQ